MIRTERFKGLEEKIGYTFTNKRTLALAMTHSSYANEQRGRRKANNERLEFLGDAVLELISSDYLFAKYPETPEGVLTKKRASMVCEPTLALCAREIPLGDYLLLGKGEDATGGRKRDSIVSDAMEALIGAIYLDGGFANAKEFIDRFILNDIENKQLFYDSKTTLQEIVQGEGPDHNKSFYVHALLGNTVLGEGTGHTKKAAEQQAAYCAIKKLKSKGGLCI